MTPSGEHDVSYCRQNGNFGRSLVIALSMLFARYISVISTSLGVCAVQKHPIE